MIWLVFFAATLIYFVPRIKERSRIMSEARSMLTGRVVDSYTNILTVKLFAHAEREDDYARYAITDHTGKFQDQLRLITVMKSILYIDQRRADRWHRRHGALALERRRTSPSAPLPWRPA